MRLTLSFLTVKKHWDTTPGKTAPFLELGPTARTYEKNIGELLHEDHPDRVLYLFNHTHDGVADELPKEKETTLWEVSNWLVEQVESGVITSNRNDFLLLLNTTFGDRFEFIKTGEHVKSDAFFCPSYIEWDEEGDKTVLYLSHSNFIQGYMGGELFVVPLIKNPEFWFTSKNNVLNELSKFTPSQNIDNINRLSLREDGTFATTTSLSSIKLRWYERGNSNNYIDTEWYIGVYGVAKNNPEDIKNAVRDYLLGSSNRPESDWLSIFPEVFNPVEFTLVPLWKHPASTPSAEATVYQPIVRIKRTVELMEKVAVDYGHSHIEDNLEVIPCLKSSISMLGLGAPANTSERFRLSVLYPKYFLVSDFSGDWTRLPPDTREFVDTLHNIVQVAKTATGSSMIPAGVHRVYRHGHMFIAGKIHGITLLMISRQSYLERLDPINNSSIEEIS